MGAGLTYIADNFSRALNGAGTALYSGGERALQAAKDSGGTVIRKSIGKAAEIITKDMPWEQAKPVWEEFSAQFCRQASGVVNAYICNSAYNGVESIFWSVEMPTLLNNPNVTEIIIHILNEWAKGSDIDLRKKYFYITINFSPDYDHVFKCIDGDLYLNTLTGEKFRKRLLYDFGWGQETGFEKQPSLAFDELIGLVENSVTIKKKRIWEKYSQEERMNNDISQNNLYGAISVIMQDHIVEFIEFLSEKINTDYFSNEIIRKNYFWFSFSTSKMHEMGYIPSGIRTKSFEEVLNEYEQWRKISKIVVEQVYQ